MKNKRIDLNNHLFAALERLNNEDLKDDDLKTEISRAQAIAEVGKVLVDSAKTAIMHAKLTGKTKDLDEEFDESKQIERPAAVYTNKGHLSLTGS